MFFVEVLDYGVEAGTALAVGDGDVVHIDIYRYHSATEETAHLVGDVEDEGGVLAVVELHVHVDVVAVVEVRLGNLRQRLRVGTGAQLVGVEVRHAEGEEFAADDVNRLTVLSLAVELHTSVEVHGDGVGAGDAVVEIHGTRHTAEVGIAVGGSDLTEVAVVMVEDNLHEIDIRYRLQLHVETAYPTVARGIEGEAVEVSVYLYSAVVAGEEFLRLIEGAGELRGVVAGRYHGLSGEGSYVVVGR